MIIKFKVLVNSSLELYQEYDCEILALFKYNRKQYYIAFYQESKYTEPMLMFLCDDDKIELINDEIPTSWIKTSKLRSDCYYDGILHFSLKLSEVNCPKWMIDDSSFFANVLDNTLGYDQLYNHDPNCFKSKSDIDIFNK